MKLEPKHLLPYFPYGLEFLCTDSYLDESDVLSWTAFDSTGGGFELRISNIFIEIDDLTSNKEEKYYPILKPLSDITEHHAKVWGYSSVEKLIKAIREKELPYHYMEELFEEFFDFQDLISKGLAVDIKDISNIAQTIINSVKVELDFIKLTDSKEKPTMIG